MRRIVLSLVLVGGFVLSACGSKATPLPPVATRTPAPTFTPTAEIVQTPVNPVLAATAQAAAEAAANNPNPGTGSNDQALAPTPTPVQPTPTTLSPQATINTSIMNVRGGPGTNYPVIGTANNGESFTVTGKNQAGNWWQVDYNGQPGWLFGELVTTQATQAVAIASNIPVPPPTATPLPPTATPIPQPTAPPPTAAPQYEFPRALLQGCAPNGGVTYVQGTVYRNHVPTNGYTVVFSYAPDGPVVASQISGPHEGYPNWNPGFYSHILKSDGPREGNWFFWIVDSSGKRISELGNVHTDGEAGDGKCQQAIIDFDTN